VVNPKKLVGILANLEKYLVFLRELAEQEQVDFLADFTKVGSARYFLQVAVESCINAAHHIIASEKFRAPQDYFDSFVVLKEENIIPDDFLPTLRQMVRFRNRLVHLYWEADDEIVYDILQTNLDDFEIFTQHVLAFMEEAGKAKGKENG
jgi:uncharacterized protein YutE (UPF0331/DUF86 family)